ncbi:MAG: hypothetical protein D6689_18380 [Deltaproteobacteria bacterium]|nr:MAG: hypothetical protein D6689_18380 [Deltaproteobacteria bacterium]
MARRTGEPKWRRTAAVAAPAQRARGGLPRAWAAAAAAVALAVAAPAWAYDFEVRALTVGQGYSLRWLRPVSGDSELARRRFTQSLSLSIWNIGRPPRRLRYDTALDPGPDVYVTAWLRIDHDFGSFTGGSLVVDANRYDAVDLIPELESSSLAVDVLYAYAGVRGLAGVVDVAVGRQLAVDTLDWWSFDGATVRVHTPWRAAIEAFGGMRVRDASPVAAATLEPDGTAGGECPEYVEGVAPGTGSWRPIDRPVPGGGNPFEADFDRCPQRDEWMPTFGAAIETDDLPVVLRASYRRSVSRTPGLIGGAVTMGAPDRGLYPNERGQAPGWGVNEERVSTSARYVRRLARGAGQVATFAAARYSLLHGLIDEALAGVQLQWGAHRLSPEYFYSYPTFDGDSIFNVFSTRPYHDARLTYELAPDASALSGYVRGWLRAYGTEDAAPAGDGGGTALGAHAGGRYRASPWSYARLDLFWEDGYGGRRAGGFASARWRLTGAWDVASRVSVVRFDDELIERRRATSFGGQLGATYRIAPGIAAHATVEDNYNRLDRRQLRVLAVLDLAFHPEVP